MNEELASSVIRLGDRMRLTRDLHWNSSKGLIRITEGTLGEILTWSPGCSVKWEGLEHPDSHYFPMTLTIPEKSTYAQENSLELISRKPPEPDEPCPIAGCRSTKRSGYLMCKSDWLMVPPQIQTRVFQLAKKAPGSAAHSAACREAVDAVLTRLGAQRNRSDPRRNLKSKAV